MQLFRIVLLFILFSALAGCNEHLEPVVQHDKAPPISVPSVSHLLKTLLRGYFLRLDT